MTDTAHFRGLLEEEKGRLETQLGTVGRRNPSNPGDWEAVPQETGLEADPTDTAEQIEGYEENTAILKELEARYQDVLGALGRLDAGTYGVCAIGGEAIEEARLTADPAARTCKAHIND